MNNQTFTRSSFTTPIAPISIKDSPPPKISKVFPTVSSEFKDMSIPPLPINMLETDINQRIFSPIPRHLTSVISRKLNSPELIIEKQIEVLMSTANILGIENEELFSIIKSKLY